MIIGSSIIIGGFEYFQKEFALIVILSGLFFLSKSSFALFFTCKNKFKTLLLVSASPFLPPPFPPPLAAILLLPSPSPSLYFSFSLSLPLPPSSFSLPLPFPSLFHLFLTLFLSFSLLIPSLTLHSSLSLFPPYSISYFSVSLSLPPLFSSLPFVLSWMIFQAKINKLPSLPSILPHPLLVIKGGGLIIAE